MNNLIEQPSLSSNWRLKVFVMRLYPIWGLFIAIAWRGEEPSKFNTILVVWMVQLIGWLIIKKAKKAGIIHSETTWIIAFSIKLLVTLLIVQYVWTQGSAVQGGYRTAPPNFDPIVFDWGGVNLAKHNMNPLYVISYNYVGIIYYIGLIYYIFGVSTFYIGIFNTLFSLLTFLSVAGILHLISRQTKPWQIMALGMFFPEIIFYDAIPSKEILVSAFLFMAMFFLYSTVYKKGISNYFLSALSLFLLLTVRTPIVAIAIAVATIPLFWNFRKNRRLLFPLSFGVILFFYLSIRIVPNMGGYTFNPVGKLIDIQSKIRLDSGAGPHSITLLFMPKNLKQAIVFAPFRTIFFLVAPFPRLLLDLTIFSDFPVSYQIWMQNFTKLSLLCIIILMPSLFAAIFQERCRRQQLYSYIVIPFILMMVLVANGMYLIHPRYRVMLDPILLGTALFGYRYGKPKVFILPMFLVILAGFIGYSFLKSIA